MLFRSDLVSGTAAIMKDAVAFKVLAKPLSDDDLRGLSRVPFQ